MNDKSDPFTDLAAGPFTGLAPEYRVCTCSMTQTVGDCPRHDAREKP